MMLTSSLTITIKQITEITENKKIKIILIICICRKLRQPLPAIATDVDAPTVKHTDDSTETHHSNNQNKMHCNIYLLEMD